MDDDPPLDPNEVLGVGPEATAEALREAFRTQSRKYHPDHGGDAWAFRVVQWAYQRRLQAATREEAWQRSQRVPAPRPSASPPPTSGAPAGSRWESPRPGLRDRGLDPSQLVEVELVQVHREADIPLLGVPGLLIEDRSLGARLTFQWPDREVTDDPRAIPHAELALRALAAVFEEARERPGVTSARWEEDAGRFTAWLSYDSATAARKALRHLHLGLRARGLGMNQWNRVMCVPRAGKRG